MARKEDDEESDDVGALSRREILVASLVGAGATLAQAAPAAAQTAARMVGVAANGATAVEFRSRLTQTGDTGEHFVAFGYLSRVENAADGQLFVSDQQNETTALLTAYASGDLVRRIHDGSVHSIDIEGTLTVFQRFGPGASYNDPDSFKVGTPIASFAVTLLDVLTVFAPGKGLPVLSGDMRQVEAGPVDGLGGAQFGHIGAKARLSASGIGTLVDPVKLTSVLEMAGSWTAA
jgi:hypothetical protein